MADRMREILDFGQAIWLDYIRRDLIRSETLRDLVKQGVTGLTSNPTIFQKAVAEGSEYDEQIRELARAGRSREEIYEAITQRDIAAAADILRPVYDETHGRDGFVSLEVNPALAYDTEGTLAEARRLFAALDRPNVMIKVPATPQGLPAVRTLIAEGINVNVTLIFAIQVYEQVMQAYLDGLRQRLEAGKPLTSVASVASFFVSRIDTLVDRKLNEKIEAGQKGLETLLGQVAVANARIAYDRFRHVFGSETFAPLRRAGARVQRPLWASTSTKNPAYSDVKYVDALIGPDTVNTVPPQTLEALRDHATPARTIDMDVEQSYAILERLATAGIDMQQVTAELLEAGVRAFAESFEALLTDIENKRARFAA